MTDFQVRGRGGLSRRRFLKAAAACGGIVRAGPKEAPQPNAVSSLSEHLLLHHGPINVGIVRDGDAALLIDCGDGRVAGSLPDLGIKSVAWIAFTHHHRDQACGAYDLAAAGTRIGVPAAEREYFTDPARYWSNEQNHWRVYSSFRPHRLMLTEPLRVDASYRDGQEFTFGSARIRVISTPGHTDGAVSYVVDVDGRRVVFCGDCMYDPGRVWDIHGLQRGFSHGGEEIGGYHGFMGDRWRLAASLQAIKKLDPQVLVPSHGAEMSDPAGAIDVLTKRLEACYEKYVGISALRHYFPKLFTDYAGRPGQMPIRPGIEQPECLRHFGTTWMLVSGTGEAFVMDIGSAEIAQQLKKMLSRGEIKSVEGLWVTHYHFDHTDGIHSFQKEFACPCITDKRLAEVLENPRAWRLPCLAPEAIRVDRPMEDGQSWQWREYRLTSYYYPGQTLYHAALLAEGKGLRMLFVGDSHTMAGIDDYCAYNRNWLGRGVGFQYCLSLIEKIRPTHIFNCHVDSAFTFTQEEVAFMRINLDERERLFGDLLPWEHANFGMDEAWVRCAPYWQKAAPGSRMHVHVVVTNHAGTSQTAACRPVLPRAWGSSFSEWRSEKIPAATESPIKLTLAIPSGVSAARYVLPIDVKYGARDLPQFAEAIIDVTPAGG